MDTISANVINILVGAIIEEMSKIDPDYELVEDLQQNIETILSYSGD